MIIETPLPGRMHRGKVRDTYDLGAGRLLMVATDRISAFDVVDGKSLAKARIFCDMGGGSSDGIRVDVDGNVWSAAGWGGDGFDGVHVFAPDGDKIGEIHLPEAVSNVCFGGVKRNRLFITGSQSLYSLYVESQGVPYV